MKTKEEHPRELSLKELKEYTIYNNNLKLTLMEILGVFLCDNKEYIYKLYRENSAKKDETDG